MVYSETLLNGDLLKVCTCEGLCAVKAELQKGNGQGLEDMCITFR